MSDPVQKMHNELVALRAERQEAINLLKEVSELGDDFHLADHVREVLKRVDDHEFCHYGEDL